MNEETLARMRRVWSGVLGAFAFGLCVPAYAQMPLKLTVGEEAAVDLSAFTYTGAAVSVELSSNYLLCANTPWLQSSPTPTAVQLNPANGTSSLVNQFEFGIVTAAGAPVVLNDVRSFRYVVDSQARVEVNKTAAPGTLGCFVTNTAGDRASWYNGLFVDGFDTVPAPACSTNSSDSCAAIRVASVVADTDANRIVYTYFIDYHLPAGAARYTLRDGYATAFFGPQAAPQASTVSWCPTLDQASTACSGASNLNRTVDVALTSSAGAPTNGRIRVVRRTIPGVTINQLQGASGALVIAALFPESAALSLERNLADNVARGTASLSDQAPVFTQLPSALTAVKSTGMAATSFTISDDTAELAGNLLRASATVRFNTLGSFPASVNCGSATPLPGQPTRACTVSFVPPAGFTNFATAAGSGVTADIVLTATDTFNQSTSTAALPLTVTSNVNSVPSFGLSTPFVDVGGVPTVTLICNQSDLLAGHGSASCGLKGAQAIYPAFLTSVMPGPVDAQDEIALQEAFADTTGVNQISCDSLAIFNLPSPPRIQPVTYNLTYTVNGIAGVANCDVVVRDRMIGGGSFPVGQSSQSKMMRLKIEVVDDVP